ncbi:hypothetical protein GQ457_02G027900 [Hibiscus cannabinus]
MNATGLNGPIGMDASHSDGSNGVSFSLDDGVVVDGNETNGNEKARDKVDGNEANGNDVARDEQPENGAYENAAHLVGLYSGEETKYLDSTDVGSYEIDSDGNVIPKESGQKEKFRVVCKGKGCPFVVNASRDKSDGCFKVKTMVTDHNCFVTFKNSIANYKFIGKYFISNLRILPTLRSVQMIKLDREELNVELNKKLCFRAKKWALKKIRGSVVHEFHKLWDYVSALFGIQLSRVCVGVSEMVLRQIFGQWDISRLTGCLPEAECRNAATARETARMYVGFQEIVVELSPSLI